ncbi:MAG: hypothetical protein AABZ74_16685 [Cyanobacteriota bacterium]
MKKIIILTSFLLFTGCMSQPKINTENLKYSVEKAEKGFISNAENTYTINVSDKKGASFLTKINILDKNFTTKSASGGLIKTSKDISKFDIYLLELASAPSAGSDPLGTANANVKASQIGVAKKSSSFNILFNNLPANNTGNSYFVAVVSKDSGNVVINKPPSSAWGGNTLATLPNLSVTSSGVSINASLVVSTTTDLSLSLSLLDDAKASVDSDITIINGNSASIPAVTAN